LGGEAGVDEVSVEDAFSVPELPDRPAVVLPLDGWTVRPDPTMDNHWGDFDRHTPTPFAGVDIRRFLVRTERAGEDGLQDGWAGGGQPQQGWVSRLWSEAGYWTADNAPMVYSTVFGDLTYRTWAGRMGRVPRAFLNFGRTADGVERTASSFVHVPDDGTYWVTLEGEAVKRLAVDGENVVRDVRAYAVQQPVWLRQGWRRVEVGARALRPDVPLRVGVSVRRVETPPLPAWVGAGGAVRARFIVPEKVRGARLHAVVADGAATFLVNGRPVVTLGEFEPYFPAGQYELDITEHVRPGPNDVTVQFRPGTLPTGRALVDGVYVVDGEPQPWELGPWEDDQGRPVEPRPESPEGVWLKDRPHPLPDVGWLTSGESPGLLRDWAPDPALAGRAVWLRTVLPVGARRIRLAVRGAWTAWVDGNPVRREGSDLLVEPGPAGRELVLRVEPAGFALEGAVLLAPMYVETAAASGALGDWREVLALPTFSGAVDYERSVEGWAAGGALDLGRVRGTAEVWVDGVSLGVRLWHPYRYRVPPACGPGPRRLRVRVTNTLGAYYSDGKPTDLDPPEQWAGGWWGPLRFWERRGGDGA
jgi:hypothetical protein